MFGINGVPPVFTRPFWRDAFFWLLLGTLAFWAIVLRFLFF